MTGLLKGAWLAAQAAEHLPVGGHMDVTSKFSLAAAPLEVPAPSAAVPVAGLPKFEQ